MTRLLPWLLPILSACPHIKGASPATDTTLPRAVLIHLASANAPTRFEAVGTPEDGIQGFVLAEDPSGFFSTLGLGTGQTWIAAEGRPLHTRAALEETWQRLFTDQTLQLTTQSDGQVHATSLIITGPPQPVPSAVNFVLNMGNAASELGLVRPTEAGWTVDRQHLTWLSHQRIPTSEFRARKDGFSVGESLQLAPLLALKEEDLIQALNGEELDWPLGIDTLRHHLLTQESLELTLLRQGHPIQVQVHITGAPIEHYSSDDALTLDTYAGDRWLQVGLSRRGEAVQIPRGALIQHCAGRRWATPTRSQDGTFLGYQIHSNLFYLLGLRRLITHVDGAPLLDDDQLVAAVAALGLSEDTTWSFTQAGQSRDTQLHFEGPPIALPDSCEMRVSIGTDEQRWRAGVRTTEAGRSVPRALFEPLAKMDQHPPLGVHGNVPATVKELLGYQVALLLDLPEGKLATVQGRPVRSMDGWNAARRAFLEADTVTLTWVDTTSGALVVELVGPATILPAGWPGKQTRLGVSRTPRLQLSWTDNRATAERSAIVALLERPLIAEAHRSEAGEWQGYKLVHRGLLGTLDTIILKPIALNGKEPTTDGDLETWVRALYNDDAVTLSWLEDGETVTKTIQLTGGPISPPTTLPLSVRPEPAEAAFRAGVRWSDGERIVPRSLLASLLDTPQAEIYTQSDQTLVMKETRPELSLLGLRKGTILGIHPDDPSGLTTATAVYEALCTADTLVLSLGSPLAPHTLRFDGPALACPEGWPSQQFKLTQNGERTDRGYRFSTDELNAFENMEILSTVRMVPWKNPDGDIGGMRLSGIRRNSIWYRVGIKNGDIVNKIDDRSINSVAMAMEIVEYLKGKTSIALHLTRRNEPKVIILEAPEAPQP